MELNGRFCSTLRLSTRETTNRELMTSLFFLSQLVVGQNKIVSSLAPFVATCHKQGDPSSFLDLKGDGAFHSHGGSSI